MTAPFDENWLFASILLAAPLLYAGVGELVSQRTGVLNVGLEGMMLTGAFFSYVVVWQTGSFTLGALVGIVSGALAATIMAVLAVSLRADQIIVGVGLNILAFGITAFFVNELFPAGEVPVISRPGRVAIPLLSDIPGIGKALFDQTPLVYIAYLTVPLVSFVLFRTRFGLSIRATGEMPAAVDTAGVSVVFVRWVGVHTAGALAGLGGALLAIGELGFFREGITAGRGFLAFSAVIFGGWRPLGVLAACWIFGAADALQLRLQAEVTVPRTVWFVVLLAVVVYLAIVVRTTRPARRPAQLTLGAMVLAGALTLFIIEPSWSFPSQVWLALPFILTLLALAGFVRRGQAPRAWGMPYDRLRG
jgi:general nucleoside transport system permease protein